MMEAYECPFYLVLFGGLRFTAMLEPHWWQIWRLDHECWILRRKFRQCTWIRHWICPATGRELVHKTDQDLIFYTGHQGKMCDNRLSTQLRVTNIIVTRSQSERTKRNRERLEIIHADRVDCQSCSGFVAYKALRYVVSNEISTPSEMRLVFKNIWFETCREIKRDGEKRQPSGKD